MHIFIITPFPAIPEAVIGESILRRASEKEIVDYHVIDLREFTEGKHRQIDDYPFGGGTGMVMLAEPILKAMDRVKELYKGNNGLRVVFPSPQAQVLSQQTSRDLSVVDGIAFICGHYKGIDERVREAVVTDEISIGDYVVTGGELPAMVILDSVVRLIPGVLGDEESANTDSFTHDLLDHPHYTRPEEVKGLKVPEVLMSGHHANVDAWRQEQRELRTKKNRPDLWEQYQEKLLK
ncbi:MAG TPA: tRNA (guanosine(37)-N1)-methyltransferase TrmD [Candidatus Marinimicrobia bacterium]|jgi:tRNA (guanine37-N1)-methyltransferase|nr:tRNA (guanosine(37)-N1)-methyltransferase TrmD [Candidatus Neomarinimicrobiota bacterium]HIB03323.1 tRNA (guanosine(37)-N1)-methyltransferase TrmD [Candidatus Neomarinimicrobiota bacterium]HIB70440.1 tRNA (guanosine(37)-N1)-methyltransferase TrmD [Candidatus Neomarinimicrobiota bacterium]HIB95719.1 tRNA (guanosine(37)-N1)-methyltransferase TrmD [Candidatus Neomarinimicrobiota bacterium]HIN61329.1 tRNA (guanosine(37)-N1)-methyltransferase TrmD [Candidatus Neomarinimicrobiota bacterium]